MKRGKNYEGYSDPTATLAIASVVRIERMAGRKQHMLEKYVKDFDRDSWLFEVAKKRHVSRSAALEICRDLIPKESYFQKKILTELKKRYPKAFIKKISQGAYSEGGIPDVMCIVEGHYFGFEVKRPLLGQASKLQEISIRRIEQAGGTAALVSWPEECFQHIDGWMQKRRGGGAVGGQAGTSGL